MLETEGFCNLVFFLCALFNEMTAGVAVKYVADLV